jgi:hypothetical protein
MAKYKTSKISGFAWNYIILKFQTNLQKVFAVYHNVYTDYTGCKKNLQTL